VVCVCAALAFTAPGLAATRAHARASSELVELESVAAERAPLVRDLNAATTGLAEIARFTRGRRSTVELLTAITRALPDSTAIVSFRVDSAGGSLTLISSAAAPAVQRIAAIPGLTDVRVGGAFTRENVAGAQLQRVAVRFRFAR
jgi:hypothetical protein